MPQSGFVPQLELLVRARYPLVYLVTWEEQRVHDILEELARAHGKHLIEWSSHRGLRRADRTRTSVELEPVKEPIKALDAIGKLTEPSLVVLKDFHACFDEPAVVRAVRELGQQLKGSFSTVVFVSPTLKIPVELEKDISILDVPLPTFADLRNLLREIVKVIRAQGRVKIELSNADGEALVRAAQGLTLVEAENAFAKAIADDNRLGADDIQLVLDEKKQILRKSGLIEYISTDETMGSVGGLEYLKIWLDRRTHAFTDEARQFGLPEPKGLLMLGVQGCGKSLTAKAIASRWRLPLLRLDMGRIFAGFIGSSEENVRKAIRIAEGVAPAVLWIDEIEKGLGGSGGGGDSDGGTTARVFGALLTWMQEKTAPVFIVATANRIVDLPPELLRKGRFDEIFFIDLPSRSERADIFEIHLRRRGRDPVQFDVSELAVRSEGFSGAEIEQAIVAALYQAFETRGALTQAHVLAALAETRPLSATMREDIERLREWAQTRTRAASRQDEAGREALV
jgi:AAA+ superfamily predicted ATPase